MRGHVLPVLQLVVLPICCIATYVWSVLLGHVEAGFPYISDTGTYPPESCLFGLLLAIYAFTTAATVYLRWQQVKTFYQSDGSRGLLRANNVSLVLGLMAALGILIVANFQETNVLIVHLIGAFLAFGLGTIYTWIQSYISYKAHLLPGHRACVRHVRLALSVVATVCIVCVVVFAQLATTKRGHEDSLGHYKWSKSDKGFTEHVISTALEWALAFVSAVYFATFYKEFQQLSFSIPVKFTDAETKVNEAMANNEMQPATFTVSTISY